MPSEITLGQSMPVRCKGHILRIVRPNGTPSIPASGTAQAKIGVAVRLECYEYLPECADSHVRVAALRPRHEEEQAQPQTTPARLA
jgi:hypothetical protein